MTVPWTGFPLAELVKLANPLGDAAYLRMETFLMPDVATGQQQVWYPWPYVEGVTIAEATNELAFIVTGAYGKPVDKAMGAPLRLHLPWKYGFKSIKSIVRFTFTDERPQSYWEALGPDEYGFWANVNPEVPHPRWSQAMERDITNNESIPTRLFNGYAEYVAALYKDLEDEPLYM
jgi:sulfoxide reductase catalytic subunit YedY